MTFVCPSVCNVGGLRSHSATKSGIRHIVQCTLYLKKTAPLRQVGINPVIFQIQKNPKYTGCGKKSSPLMVFANFSAVVPEFKVKFGTLV